MKLVIRASICDRHRKKRVKACDLSEFDGEGSNYQNGLLFRSNGAAIFKQKFIMCGNCPSRGKQVLYGTGSFIRGQDDVVTIGGMPVFALSHGKAAGRTLFQWIMLQIVDCKSYNYGISINFM